MCEPPEGRPFDKSTVVTDQPWMVGGGERRPEDCDVIRDAIEAGHGISVTMRSLGPDEIRRTNGLADLR